MSSSCSKLQEDHAATTLFPLYIPVQAAQPWRHWPFGRSSLCGGAAAVPLTPLL